MMTQYGGFHEALFPETISLGMQSGPEWRVDVVDLASGAEERNLAWSAPRRRFSAAFNVRELAETREIMAFLIARDGPAAPFRFRDWSDDSTALDPVAGPTPFDDVLRDLETEGWVDHVPIYRTYANSGRVHRRRITKPRWCVECTRPDGSTEYRNLRIALDGVELTSGWKPDITRGIICFDRPLSGKCLTWGGYYDVPVRLLSQSVSTTMAHPNSGGIDGITLIEVRGDDDTLPESPADELRAYLGWTKGRFTALNENVAQLKEAVYGLSAL